jgi:hypothetical protein
MTRFSKILEESSLEDHEFGKLYFSSFRNELKSFREETDLSFAQMADKYGTYPLN